MSGDQKVPTLFNETFSVNTSGFVATFFIFAKHQNLGTDDEDFLGYVEHLNEDLIDGKYFHNDDIPSQDNNRRLATSSQKWHPQELTLPHAIINGDIDYRNKYGYLNSD